MKTLLTVKTANYIEVAGAQCVMHGLEKNTALTKLDISCTYSKREELTTSSFLKDNNIGLDGIRYVMSKLGENTTLTHLNLAGMKFLKEVNYKYLTAAGNRIKSYALVRALKGMVEKGWNL